MDVPAEQPRWEQVKLRGDDVGGIAVDLAARVMATAGTGEIVASRRVGDLVVGSDVVLQHCGSRAMPEEC